MEKYIRTLFGYNTSVERMVFTVPNVVNSNEEKDTIINATVKHLVLNLSVQPIY